MANDKLPMSPAALFSGITAILLAVGVVWVLNILEERSSFIEESGAQPDLVAKVYKGASLSAIIPDVFEPIERFKPLHWFFSYASIWLPTALIGMLVAQVLLKSLLEKPAMSLLDDPEYDGLHKGVDTPPLCHLDAILKVLPDSTSLVNLQRDICIGAVNPVAPPSVSSDIADRPSAAKAAKA